MIDAREAAELLDVSEETVRRWMRQGLLPGGGSDGTRFEREALTRWARERGIRLTQRQRSGESAGLDPLVEALRRGALVCGARADSASDAISIAMGALTDLPTGAREVLLASVLERERMASTGLGGGVAVPHPRVPSSEHLDAARVSFLLPADPVDWVAPDERRVEVVILVLAQNAAAHLGLLSRIARIARHREFRNSCSAVQTKLELMQVIANLDDC